MHREYGDRTTLADRATLTDRAILTDRVKRRSLSHVGLQTRCVRNDVSNRPNTILAVAERDMTGFEIGKDGLGGIVVGMDGSPASFHAAAWAAGLSRRERARLVLVYVEAVGGVAYWSPMGVAVASEAAESLVEELNREVTTHLEGIDIDWDFVHHRGDPAVGLEQVSEQYRADLIVVGRSRRRGGLLGTVPATLVVEAVRPVVVIP